MKGSLERVRRVLAHEKPDRIPVYDLIKNDAVLQHFNGGVPVDIGDDSGALRAIREATDASRPARLAPMSERTEHLRDGRVRKFWRWTAWESHRVFMSSDEYREIKRRELAESASSVASGVQTKNDPSYLRDREFLRQLGDDYYLALYAPPLFMNIYEEVGLEAFSYYLADCEDVIIDQMEQSTEYACRWAEGIPSDDPFEAVFMGEDIAFKTGTMVSPRWLEKHFFPRVRRVVDAIHARGKKVIFHSDGDLNQVMDSLVDAGVDVLNPIEVAAGMDLADLHARYPRLVYAGGIDVTHLLPFGTPDEVRGATVKAIEDTDGQILIGSSTELINEVPLENYLAMREAAMGYQF